MDQIERKDLLQLVGKDQDPCITVYIPTHRAGADTLQDPIRLKNQIREAERLLVDRGAEAPAIRDLLEPLRELVPHHESWQHQADGLALFRSHDLFRHYGVSFAVPELAVVARRFHLKPLLPALELNQRFYILALSQDAIKLYEANHLSVTDMEIPELPESPIASAEARGVGRSLQSHTIKHGATQRRFSIFHGHGGGEAGRKQVLLAYFRRVDETIRKRLNDQRTPIVLAGVDYLCPIYRQATTIPNLLAGEIHGNPDGYHHEELHRKAWEIASAHFRETREKAADEYFQLWHTQQASKELPAIMSAARQGRVKFLFVAVGIQKWGQVERSSTEDTNEERSPAQDQDLLNIAAVETFAAGGTVFAVPPAEVPGRGSVAAVFRY